MITNDTLYVSFNTEMTATDSLGVSLSGRILTTTSIILGVSTGFELTYIIDPPIRNDEIGVSWVYTSGIGDLRSTLDTTLLPSSSVAIINNVTVPNILQANVSEAIGRNRLFVKFNTPMTATDAAGIVINGLSTYSGPADISIISISEDEVIYGIISQFTSGETITLDYTPSDSGADLRTVSGNFELGIVSGQQVNNLFSINYCTSYYKCVYYRFRG